MAEVEQKSKIITDAQKSGPDKRVVHQSFRVTKQVKSEFNGFMEFVREQGVVGLAVGLTLGTAVTVFVKSIVDSIINPVIGSLLPGSTELSTKYVCLNHSKGLCNNKLGWGQVLSNFISFLIIAAIVYFVVHWLKLDQKENKDKKKES